MEERIDGPRPRRNNKASGVEAGLGDDGRPGPVLGPVDADRKCARAIARKALEDSPEEGKLAEAPFAIRIDTPDHRRVKADPGHADEQAIADPPRPDRLCGGARE